MTEATSGSSTRPYLIRALHEIVLNVGVDATSGLNIGNEYLEFKARFGGVARDILVPIDNVIAIFSRENGQGMAFPKVERTPDITPPAPSPADAPPPTGPRPALTRIK